MKVKRVMIVWLKIYVVHMSTDPDLCGAFEIQISVD